MEEPESKFTVGDLVESDEPTMIYLEDELREYVAALEAAARAGQRLPRPHGRLKSAVAGVNRRNRRYAFGRMRRALRMAKRLRERLHGVP